MNGLQDTMHKKVLNFSQLDLVSFGDSYTFGHGSVIESDYIKLNVEETSKVKDVAIANSIARKKFKYVSNKNCYTAMLNDRFGFRSCYNLGVPGSSNKSTLRNIKTFAEQNDVSDKFFIINLTRPDRDLIYTKNLHYDKFSPYDFIYKVWEEDKKENQKQRMLEIFKVRHNSMAETFGYYFNNYTIIMNHIMLYYALVDYLETKKINYVMFDILNDVPMSNILYNVIDNIQTSDMVKDFLYSDEYSFEDRYIENYYQDMENLSNPLYLNSFALNTYDYYVNTEQPIKKFMPNLNRYVHMHPTEETVMSPIKGDPHWNTLGHKIFTDLLEDWILKHYERE